MIIKGSSNVINFRSVIVLFISVIATLFLSGNKKGNKKKKKSRVSTFSNIHSLLSSVVSDISVREKKNEVIKSEGDIKVEKAILFDI